MTYSIIKVEGLSMKPFLISKDYVLVELNPLKILPSEGSCVYSHDNVHRLVAHNQIKGDRLIYNDNVNIDINSMHLVLGRVLISKPTLIISNYNHPILRILSKYISAHSKKNIESHRYRSLHLVCIIIFSSIHRSIEKYFPFTQASL